MLHHNNRWSRGRGGSSMGHGYNGEHFFSSEFAAIIRGQLDEAVQQGLIQPIDTEVASRAWVGALNEVITDWVFSGRPERLEDAFDALRPLLMQSVGLSNQSAPSVRHP